MKSNSPLNDESCCVEAVSVDGNADDHFSDDEHQEVEALQHLPPDERRKALRRLRNRESARRVRARRLQEMSHMEVQVTELQEENTALKAHVAKLQSHVQAVSMKIYEVTAKYEAAVAETAQMRAELQRVRRPSAHEDGSLGAQGGQPTAPATTMGAGSGSLGPNPAPALTGLEGGAGASTISGPHVQLRSSSPLEQQNQRQALQEVMFLLHEHKRRNQAARQERSICSEIASTSAFGTQNVSMMTATAHSDGLLTRGNGAVGCSPFCGDSGSNMCHMGVGHNRGRSSMDIPVKMETTADAVLMSHAQLQMHGQTAGGMMHMGAAAGYGSSQMHHHSMPQLMNDERHQPSINAMQALGSSMPHTMQPQQPQAVQSYSQPLLQVQMQQPPQFGHCQQYSGMSGMSATFFVTANGCGATGFQPQQQQGPAVSGSGLGSAAMHPQHHSASFILDRATPASNCNVVSVHPTWHHNAGLGIAAPGGANGVGMLRPEEIPEDIFMSLDDYVPQDL